MAATDEEALAAFEVLSATEGIVPAFEPSHALAFVLRARESGEIPAGARVLLNLCGRGDKDLETYFALGRSSLSLAALRTSMREGPAVSPFLMLGDPTPDLSVELARTAVAAGAGMLEIGFPYSDPAADGPAIQAATGRALAGGTSTRRGFELLGRIAEACPGIPLNLLVYGNLVHRTGYERFTGAAADAGASTLLVPDIPIDEATPLRRACRRSRLGHVELAGPLTPAPRLRRLAAASRFLYLAGFQGVTGVRAAGFDGRTRPGRRGAGDHGRSGVSRLRALQPRPDRPRLRGRRADRGRREPPGAGGGASLPEPAGCSGPARRLPFRRARTYRESSSDPRNDACW